MNRLLLSFVLLAACTPQATPPRPDSGDASPAPVPTVTPADFVASGCANLALIGCSEGGPLCVPEAHRILDARLTPIRPDCWAAATDKPSARACGLKCP